MCKLKLSYFFGVAKVAVIAKLLLVFSVFCVPYFSFIQPVMAETVTFTSKSDWDAGTLSSTRSDVTLGNLELKANGTWGARTWKSPATTLSIGTSFASDGTDIYASFGLGRNYFRKYVPTTDSWTDLASLPYGTYYGADMVYLDGYIYMIFGGYQRSFARYSIADDSWEILTEVPDLVYEGGSIATDGTDLYVLRGNTSQDFYKYDVSETSWATLTGTPATIRRGADLVKIGSYFYTPRGSNTTTMYRYDISGNSWDTLSAAPASIYDEVDMTTDGTDLYLPRQNNTTTFYKYTVATDSWSTLTAAPATARYAGVVYNSADSRIYFFRGNNQYHFWKYNPATDTFIGSEDATSTLGTGSDVLYYDGDLYVLRGANQTTFYKYDISANSWSTLTASPVSYNDDVKGVVAGSYLYFYRGSNTSTFYRYDPSGDSWTQMSDTPSTVRYGGALAYPGSGDYIYGTRGNTQNSFWRYSISGDSWDDGAVADLSGDAESSYGSRLVSDGTDIYYNTGRGISEFYKYSVSGDTWSSLADLPFAPYYGTDLVYYSGKILALAGWYETDFWEYDISGDSWRKLPNTSGYLGTEVGPYNGASIEYDGSSTLYITPGASRTEVYTYTPGAEDYVSSGTWVSSTQDLTYVASWTSLSHSATTPDDSAVAIETRSSSDASTWTDWETVVEGSIASTAQRYLQIRATLTASTDGEDTPVLQSISVSYSGDTTAPTNPSSISALSQQVGGSDLTDGESYSHLKPYFSWSGASDGQSSVSGYYVYFGTNASADPVTDGSFQTTTSYIPSINFATGTYYLLIKTKDANGNVANAQTAFTYVYNGISPTINVQIDETAEFTGTATDTAVSGDAITLSSKAGFWLESRLSNTPATMQYGAKNVAYVSSSNKFYVFRGNNSTTFYEYDIDSDVWSTLAAAPAAVRMGGGVVEGPTGYLYGLRGNNQTAFWRYDIAADSWSDEAAADAPLAVHYGGSMVFDGSQYIYILRGNNDDTFWRYDTLGDTWDSMALVDFGATTDAVNNSAYVSANLALDSTNEIIYATQGNYRDGFSVYDIATDTWSVLADVPALPYNGSTLEYSDVDDSVYFMPGNGYPHLFKYSVSAGTWSEVTAAPIGFNYGASLNKVGNYLYAIRGGNSNSFFKYDLALDSWLLPSRGLFGTEYEGSSSLTANYGADVIAGDGTNLYITRGNYSDSFVVYDYSSGTTTHLKNLPAGAYNGASLGYDSTNSKIYFIPGSHLTKLYVYDIASDTWSEESNDPPPAVINYGSNMTYDGSQYFYVNRGGNASTFYRFDTQGSSGAKWTTLSSAPAGLGYGAELVYKGGYVYTLRGQNVADNPFYRYEVATDTWDDGAVADLSIDVYNDGFLVDGGDGYLYLARGDNDTEFFRYSISGDAWSSLVDVPANVYLGGSAASNGSTKTFVLPGAGSNTYSDALYTYIQQTTSSSFEESGTYVSQTHDLTSVYAWGSLVVNYTDASSAGLTIETRSSSDGSTWSSWTAVSNEKQVGSNYSYSINSAVNRYLQVRFSFTSTQGIKSDTVNSYVVSYYQDTDEPTNPSDVGLSAYSDNTPGTAISSGTWYSHSAPYFDWPDAEATYGASDTSTGSGVSGYYVYFGTNATADPEVDGTLQVATNYTASSLSSGNTYYLRIKTVDDAGNVASTAWAPFTYKYDAEGPTALSDVTADPSGYTATDSFDFSWSAASSDGAPVSQYCYKTGASSGDYASDQCTSSTSVSGVPSYKAGTNTFYVRSLDDAGNYSSYATTSYFFADISNAPAPPQNLAVDPSTNTENAFAFSWDAPATGTFYGSAANLTYYYSINALPTAQSTTEVSGTSLEEGAYATLPGDNVFYIATKDEAGNIDYDNYESVSFTANTSAPGIPLNIDIADVSVKSTSSWKLAVSWESPASVGSGVSTYQVYRSTDASTYTLQGTSGGISYVDVGLTQQTYYYKVKACDSTNNCGAFSEVVSLYPDGKFTSPANLVSDPVVSGVTTKKATISWTTDRTSDSKISFGTSSGEYNDEEVSNSEHITSHTLTLTNLSPGVTYYYVAKWTDEDGNTGTSDELTFTTDPPPTTEEPTVSSVGLTSALIEFVSKNASSVKVYYGETTAFGGVKEVITGTAEGTYTVQLTGLDDGTKYFYQINSFDSEGEEYAGEIHSFETLPRPEISNITINQVKGTASPTILVSWETNTEVSSIVTYFPTLNPGQAKDEVNIALKTGKHQMILYNLRPQTSYSIIVKGNDIIGNEAVSPVQQLATAADTRPPQISNLKVEGEIIGDGEEASAQLIVTYTTDELASSQVEYGEGTGSVYSQKTQEDASLTNKHLIIISGLTPSKVYHLRGISKDAAGNQALSIDKVVVSPKAAENALDLVVTSLGSVFGFLEGL